VRNPDFNAKQQVRTEVRRALRDTAPGTGATVCEAVARWLAAQPALRTVASYAAMANEVDLLPLLAILPERRWLFPRVAGDELVFLQVSDLDRDLAVGTMGIREPRPERPVVSIAEVDVFLCPGLAFDPRGGRLGRAAKG